MSSTRRALTRLLLMSALAAAFVVFVVNGAPLDAPRGRLLEALAVSFVFATCIGLLASAIMSRYGRTLWHALPPPFHWLLILGTLVAIAVAGSVVAIGLLAAVGYVDRDEVRAWMTESLRVSVIATLTFGVSISIYERMRARLEATTLALRTKERDEAEARRQAAEARLAALEARVQPHFLFNTLNSIAALIPDDPQGAERMVSRLSTLLRATLDTTSPLVPVEVELAAVRDYLEIERVRFGDRLRYELPAGRMRENIRVPRLSIQTLVENSVKYAVAPRRQGATIRVSIDPQPSSVRVRVEDDGPGFTAGPVPDQHGLALLRERLTTLFGAAALTVDGTPGRCSVTFEVPLA